MSFLSLASASRTVAWLESRGVSFTNVALSHAMGIGAGLVAARNVRPGEILVRIPPSVWKPLSALASKDQPYAERISAHAASLGAGDLFSEAALLAARLARLVDPSGNHQGLEDVQEALPYLSSIPPPDVPLLWPSELRSALLRGTSAVTAAVSQVSLSDEIHAVMLQAGSAAPSQAAFRWAQAVLLSRAHSGDGKPLALVPGLDLLNHGGPEAGAHVRHQDDAFELVATRAHAQGDPVEIDYGTRASHRFLRLYGFVPHRESSASSEGTAVHDATSAMAGDEIVVPLLPSAAELSGAPDVVLQEVAGLHRSLAACGISGSSLRLRANVDGQFALPQVGGSDQEASIALRVLLSAIDAQRLRQKQGYAACQAVEAAPGESASDETARHRARLCLKLHAREAALLETAWQQLQDSDSF